MLGKGLESLIPQKGDQNNNGGNPSPVPEPQPVQPTQPFVKPEPVQQQPEPAKEEPRIIPVVSKPAEVSAPEQVAKPVSSPIIPPHTQAPAFVAPKKPTDISDRVFHIELDKIKPNPDQPRRNFNQEGLRELANSIREFGILQPLVVSRVGLETADGMGVEYQLIAGERRYHAAKLLGLRSAPVIVRNVSLEREKLELAVIENIQRENLNPIETARAFQRLQEEFRMTQREIAAKLGKSREVVANAMRLLDLPAYLQEGVQRGDISESNARFLLSIQDPGAQKRLYEEVVKDKLTTRDVRARVEEINPSPASIVGAARRGRPPKTEAHLPPEIKAMQESLSSDLGAPIEINKGASKGQITITFYSEEELENILRRLGKD